MKNLANFTVIKPSNLRTRSLREIYYEGIIQLYINWNPSIALRAITLKTLTNIGLCPAHKSTLSNVLLQHQKILVDCLRPYCEDRDSINCSLPKDVEKLSLFTWARNHATVEPIAGDPLYILTHGLVPKELADIFLMSKRPKFDLFRILYFTNA